MRASALLSAEVSRRPFQQSVISYNDSFQLWNFVMLVTDVSLRLAQENLTLLKGSLGACELLTCLIHVAAGM
jgi:hypothetical protein